MYLITNSKSFRKSFKKIEKSGMKDSILKNLKLIINTIAREGKLSAKYKNHNLKGIYKGYSECHIKGDLILIYKLEKLKLILVDINSHSELF